MSFLALDWGLKKVGVATSDPDGRVITPRAGFLRKTTPQLWSLTASDKEELLKLKETFEVSAVILGNPVHPKKSPEALKKAYKNFCDKLFTLLAVPVHSEDETLTSWDAKKSGIDPKNEDSVAAGLILKNFLLRRPKA